MSIGKGVVEKPLKKRSAFSDQLEEKSKGKDFRSRVSDIKAKFFLPVFKFACPLESSDP